MTESLPRISIITVVYNGANHLEQAMRSVLEQGYPNLEYIVIDGESTDGSVEIIQSFDSQISQWVSEKDDGIYNAMNKGIARATGDLIGILNADDFYQAETLRRVAKTWQESGKPDIIYGDMHAMRSFADRSYFRRQKTDLSRIEESMYLLHPATFVTRKTYQEIGGFDEQYRLSADYEFLFRAYRDGRKFQYLEESLTVFRIGGATATNCRTYEEGYQILVKYDSPHQDAMKSLIGLCKKKNKRRKIIHNLASALGLRGVLEKRIEAKWKKT